MLSFLIDGVHFNLRAAALIVDDGHLLLHRAREHAIWSLPGGRVEPGEAASDAIVRELMEETGETVECQELAFIVENFFDWQGVPVHEIGFYAWATLVSPRLRDKCRSHAGIEAENPLEYRWFSLGELPGVNLFPEFLRTASFARGAAPQHVVQGTPRVVP